MSRRVISPKILSVLLGVALSLAAGCKLETIRTVIEEEPSFWQWYNGPIDSLGFPVWPGGFGVTATGHQFVLGRNLATPWTVNAVGLYSSTNNGSTWSSLRGAIPISDSESLFSLTVEATGELYVCSSWYHPNSSFPSTAAKIFYSADEGVRWTTHDAPLLSPVGINAQVSMGCIFIWESASRLLRSSDHGATWAILSTGISGDTLSTFEVGPAGSLFCGLRHGGIIRSLDNGGTWERTGTGLPSHDGVGHPFVNNLGINPGGVLVAGFQWMEPYWSDLGCGIYRSIDNGTTWTHCLNNLAFNERVNGVLADGTHTFYVNTDRGTMRTTDDGGTWERLENEFNGMELIGADHYAYLNQILTTGNAGLYYKSIKRVN